MLTNKNQQCIELAFILQYQVSFPESETYELGELYWSAQQSSVQPSCRVSPNSAQDVSIILEILKANDCQFAVKSGGHASFAGASNIAEAVTIDLRNLNEIIVSEDKTQVSVGSGLVWSQIYMELDALNVSVIGGRVSSIGVGGLTLGGGISFFSGRYGWACDNVNNYEVSYSTTLYICCTSSANINRTGCLRQWIHRRRKPGDVSRSLLRPTRRWKQLRHCYALRPGRL